TIRDAITPDGTWTGPFFPAVVSAARTVKCVPTMLTTAAPLNTITATIAATRAAPLSRFTRSVIKLTLLSRVLPSKIPTAAVALPRSPAGITVANRNNDRAYVRLLSNTSAAIASHTDSRLSPTAFLIHHAHGWYETGSIRAAYPTFFT